MRRLLVIAVVAVFAGLIAPVGAYAHTSPKPAYGTVTGQVGYEGGAFPGGFHATTGSVKISNASSVRVVEVPTVAGFSVALSPGAYTFVGCAGAHATQCPVSFLWQTIVVKAGSTQTVQLVTFLAP